jgi:hypothetical protein
VENGVPMAGNSNREDGLVTKSVYLHVGCPKSGTTYLQRVLDLSAAALGSAGVLVVGKQHVDRVQAALQVRQDPRWKQLPPGRRDMWGALVDQIRAWQGHSAILSYELFSAATADQAARAIGDLAAYDVHVVITGRDLARSVPSAWQERLKFGAQVPLEEWTPGKGASTAEWGWRTTDPSAVAQRWGRDLAPDHVHVVTVPRTSDEPTLLWQRFADACDVSGVEMTFPTDRVNESLGLVESELLRRVNGHLRAPLEGSREKARWLRDVLGHRVLAPQGSESLGMSDTQFLDAERRATRAIERIRTRGYAVHGELDDLAASRPDGRLPSAATDQEVLDSALRTIVDLLVLVREESRSRPAADDQTSPRGRVRRRFGVLRDDRARARLAELETEVAAGRRLHLRVAALQDVVTELLLPAEARDGKVTAQALRDYREATL